ncbi:hypothetical protein H845_747 [Komagataeibacter xylinus E25]|nr:hypothetical protein H845_747 [Komagataeibacter xylinus E25]
MSDLFGYQSAAPQEAMVERVTHYVSHIEGAAALLKVAHFDDTARVALPRHRRGSTARTWYSEIIRTTSSQLHWILLVFERHPARGKGIEAELAAFRNLSALTPANGLLVQLIHQNRHVAVKELTKQLKLLHQQFEAAVDLEENLATDNESVQDELVTVNQGFEQARDALLERAGGSLSLTEAAQTLGITRQALHKRIMSGTVLGMMGAGNEIIVPKLQIFAAGEKPEILRGISAVTKLFKEASAGSWMALQFLVDSDPNLGRTPIEALRVGEPECVVQAARANLHLDEE